MKRLLFILMLLCGLASAQVDIRINNIGPYIDLTRSALWATTGPGGTDNNYIFTPSSPDQGMCLYVANNDSVQHGFRAQVYTTGDQTVNSYAGNTAQWKLVSVGGSNVFYSAPTTTSASFYKTSGAARVTVVLSSTTVSGTANIFIVQNSSGSCVTSPYPSTLGLNKFASTSYSTGQSFSASACRTNPGVAEAVLYIRGKSTATGAQIFLQKVRYSTTAVGRIDVDTIGSSGTTCTARNITTGIVSVGGSSNMVAENGCSVQPTTLVPVLSDELAANTPAEFDMSGYWLTSLLSGNPVIGVFTPVAITGDVCATIQWTEVQ